MTSSLIKQHERSTQKLAVNISIIMYVNIKSVKASIAVKSIKDSLRIMKNVCYNYYGYNTCKNGIVVRGQFFSVTESYFVKSNIYFFTIYIIIVTGAISLTLGQIGLNSC